MTVNLRWLGTAGVELSCDGQVILIDPYLSRTCKKDILFHALIPKREAIKRYTDSIEGKVRAVIAGHTHFDHVLDIPALARCLDAPIFGSSSLDTLLSISGLPGKTTVCHPQERIILDSKIAISMIPSAHGLALSRLLLLKGDINPRLTPPLRTHQYRLGAMFASQVEMGGLTFLHVGSAGYVEKELEDHRCDVLFLCVAGWRKWPEYPQRIIEMVRPSCVVPIHHDDFSAPLMPGNKVRVMRSADLEGFCDHAKMGRTGLEVRPLEPFIAASF
jgi:L-ascorbate metabolism protein UlaG (beta-lactamase superfamily)